MAFPGIQAGGGGGAYSEIVISCNIGDTITWSVGVSPTDSWIKLNGTIVCSAPAGLNGTPVSPPPPAGTAFPHIGGKGGLASAAVGATKYNGGDGGDIPDGRGTSIGGPDGSGGGGGGGAGPSGAGSTGAVGVVGLSQIATLGGAGGGVAPFFGTGGGGGGSSNIPLPPPPSAGTPLPGVKFGAGTGGSGNGANYPGGTRGVGRCLITPL